MPQDIKIDNLYDNKEQAQIDPYMFSYLLAKYNDTDDGTQQYLQRESAPSIPVISTYAIYSIEKT